MKTKILSVMIIYGLSKGLQVNEIGEIKPLKAFFCSIYRVNRNY